MSEKLYINGRAVKCVNVECDCWPVEAYNPYGRFDFFRPGPMYMKITIRQILPFGLDTVVSVKWGTLGRYTRCKVYGRELDNGIFTLCLHVLPEGQREDLDIYAPDRRGRMRKRMAVNMKPDR